MEDDSITLDIPELDQVPSIEFDDLASLSSVESRDGESPPSDEPASPNIAKIHEYLDRDLADQDALIERLKAFERTLDGYIQAQTHGA